MVDLWGLTNKMVILIYFNGINPLVMTKIAIDNGPVEIVSFPINSMVIFHRYVNVYQRVT